jgi:hypothetical protein
MKHALAAFALLAAGAGTCFADAVEVAGKVCRAGRRGDRLLVSASGARARVVVPDTARVSFEGRPYEAADVRPGDAVTVFGDRDDTGRVTALRVEVSVPVATAIADALLGTRHRLVGRFAVREAKTEFFSLNVPGGEYVRVNAKSAYGPKGRVRVSTLRSGDLLEVDGKWTKKGEIEASSIRILTDDDACDAPPGETREEAAVRELAERRFLDGYDDEEADETDAH